MVLNVLNGIYGFISVPLLLTFYGKADYGLIAIAMSVNVYLRLLDLGFHSTNVKFYSSWLAANNKEGVKKLFSTSLAFYGIIGLINSSALILLSAFVEDIFKVHEYQITILRHLLWILSISAFISWYSSCFNQLIMSSENVGWVQRLAIIPKFFQILIIGLVYLFDFSITVYFFLTTFAVFITLPLTIHKLNVTYPYITFRPYIHYQILKNIVPYSISIFGFSIFQLSQESLRPVLLGIRVSAEAVAEYKVIGSLVNLTLMIGGSFMSSVLPSASFAVAQKNRLGIEKIAYQGTKYITIVLSFCVFGLITIHRELLLIYVGSEYLHLSFWLIIWTLCMLFGHNQGISAVILAGNDILLLTYSSAVAAVLCLTSCWFLLPDYGIGATVIGYFIYCSVQFCFYYGYFWRKKLCLNTFQILIHSFLRPVIISSIACITSFFIFSKITLINNTFLIIFMKGLTFILLFTVLQLILSINNEDKNIFYSIFKRNSNKENL